MLRQRDSVLRELINPKSRSRNLSAASVLRANGKTAMRERDGLVGWLKGIFNKAANRSNEDRRSHEVAAAIVNRALQRDHPEIAVVPEAAADPLRKVDVVNQKLANLGAPVAAGPTTKFGNTKFRSSVGQRNATECGHTNAIQQLAIYAEPSASGIADFEEQKKTRETTPERGRDSLLCSSSWLFPALPDEIHRAERIGRGTAIEFAARDDPDVAAHYRRYTSPRHCYRLPPLRTKQPALLLATHELNRNISVPTCAVAACAAKNSEQPPIREPNMPEKREKKDEKKQDKKKEPVIRTEGESIDSSESRAAMVAEDNLSGDPDAPFRYEWGVKLAEEEPARTSDNDNFAEKGQRYVTKQLWGVNLTHPKPDVGDAVPTSKSPGRGAHEHRNASRGFASEDIAAETGETKGQEVPPKLKTASAIEQVEPNWGAKDDKFSWTDRRNSSSTSEDTVASQQETSDARLPTSSQALRKVMKVPPDATREPLDDGYNVPVEVTSDAEVSAWRNLAMKSKPAILAILSAARPERLESVSIRPEAPQPKLDVRVVRSVEDAVKDEQAAGFKLSSMGFKRVGLMDTPNTDPPSLDNLPPSKKLHTASAQINRALWNPSGIVRRGIGSFSVKSNFTGESTRVKNSRIMLTFSTISGSSQEEKINNNVPNQQDGQQIDLKNFNKEKSSSPDTNDSLKSTEKILPPAELQTASSGDQKQLVAETNVTETTNIVANEANDRTTETSTKQSQDTDRESADHVLTSTMVEPRIEGERVHGETKRSSYEDSYSRYNRRDSYDVDHDDVTTDSDRAKSLEAESTEEAAESILASAENTVPNSNAEDASDDDLGRQYVTDGDYVRMPGDPYPYSKKSLDKWRMPVSRSQFYAPIKRQTLLSGLPSDRPTPRNANDAYANAAGQSYGSHAVGAVMETSGSGDGAMGAKNVGLASGLRASSRDQRVVAPDCEDMNVFGPRGWTKEALSKLDNTTATTASGKTNEAERGDNASLHAYHQ